MLPILLYQWLATSAIGSEYNHHHDNIKDSKYVTRFIFSGDLSSLNKDAEFDILTGTKPDVDPDVFNPFRDFIYWLKNLFSK